MEKILGWVEAFNNIARSENNFHSFYIERRGGYIGASLTLEDITRVENCRAGNFAIAAVTLEGEEAFLEISTGVYKKCPTSSGYTAEYIKNIDHRLSLGGDPRLAEYIRSMKNEGEFVTLIEAVLQATTSPTVESS
ncbi:MAG: hypothetical protein ACK4SY_05125 [Pyrobaculum sp.]